MISSLSSVAQLPASAQPDGSTVPCPSECVRASNIVGLIAAHNEAAHISSLLAAVRQYVPDCLVVADGCTDDTAARATAADAEVLARADCQGKASALAAGWRHLLARPAVDAILLLDGDGQHAAADIPAMLTEWQRAPCDLLIGQRDVFRAPMPWTRQITNRFMSHVIQGRTGLPVPDSQCGFRVVSRTFLASRNWCSTHFEIETEMLLHAAAHRFIVRTLPVKTIYHDGGSHIRVIPDLLRWLRILARDYGPARAKGGQ